MSELKGSKTHQHLKDAFAGESQANRRYLYFANKADVEGYPEVAMLFRSTAEGETGHAHGHLDYLAEVGDPATDLPIGSSQSNLASAVAGETRVEWEFGVKSNRSRTDITDITGILMQQVRNTLQVVALGVLLMVHSLAQAGDLDGYRSSFLLGPLEERLGTTLLYLSTNWSDVEREAIRLRLLMNGDTHIDLYVRASSSTAYPHGSTVQAGGSYLSYLTELKNAGLSPVLWLTPESKHPVDHQGTMDAQKAFMNSVVADYDGVTSAYVVCLECDEYWNAAQVNDLVTNLKSSTSKPIGVHLTPGVGGITGNTTYYDQADYIFLQIGTILPVTLLRIPIQLLRC